MESPSTGLGEVCHRTRSIVSTERTPWAHLCMCMRHHKHQKRTTGHVWPYMLVPVPATRVIKCGITSTESAQLGMSGHAWLSLCLPHTSLSAACTVLGTRAQQHARICCTHTHTLWSICAAAVLASWHQMLGLVCTSRHVCRCMHVIYACLRTCIFVRLPVRVRTHAKHTGPCLPLHACARLSSHH